MDMSEYLNRILELDPHKKRARVEPGLVLDVLRNAAEQHHLTFAPGSLDAQPLHLGRHDRQQFLWRPCLDGRQDAENTEELEILTYDGLRMRVGKTSEEELDRIIGGGGRRGRDLSTAERRCATNMPI